jgi:hypothetical protein
MLNLPMAGRNLLLALILAVFVFLVPPFQKPDEVVHFYKTISIARLNFACTQPTPNRLPYHYLPSKFVDLPQMFFTDHVAGQRTVRFSLSALRRSLVDFGPSPHLSAQDSACPLNPLFYLYPGLILAPLTLLPLPPIWLFYLGRLLIGLASIYIVTRAYRLSSKEFKPLILITALTPMFLNQATAFGKDWLHLSFGLLFLALLSQNTKSIRSRGLRLATLCLLVLTRWQYLPFILLLSNLPNFKKHYRPIVALSSLVIIFCLALLSLNAKNLIFHSPDQYINPLQQLLFLLGHPGYFITIPIATISTNFAYYYQSLVGLLGWLDTPLNQFIYYAFFFALAYLAYRLPVKIFQPRYALVSLLVIYFEIYSFYLFNTPTAHSAALGIQGRCFLLTIPLFAICLSPIVKSIFRRPYIFLVFSLILTALNISNRYYHYSDYYFSCKSFLSIKSAYNFY